MSIIQKSIVAFLAFGISTPSLAQSDEQQAKAQAIIADMSKNFKDMQQNHMPLMASLFTCVRTNAEKYHVLGDITAAGKMNVVCGSQRAAYTQECMVTGSKNGCEGAAGLVMGGALLPDQGQD
ncbi:hypothetical protein ACU81Q_10250 [Komagataeibacter melomenusus]